MVIIMNILVSPESRSSFESIKANSTYEHLGFTLIELVVVIALVSILVSLAVPSFTSLMADQRAKNAATDLFTALTHARGEALSRNANVTLSPKNGTWQTGWQVLGTNAEVLDDYPAITNATINGPASVVYRSSGRIAGSAAPVFVINVTHASVVRCVSLDLSGRPYERTPSC